MGRTLITVTRQLGSNGDQVALALAQEFGVPLIEHQIVEAAASAAGVSPDSLDEVEKAPTFIERMLEYLGQHAGGFDPMTDFTMEASAGGTGLTSDSYRHLVEQVLHRTAESSGAIIVGHGASVVLRDVPDVFRVLICAPVRIRAQRLQEFEHLSFEVAEARIRDDDKRRGEFFQLYYKVVWTNPAVYDLSINTARFDVPTVVEMIKAGQAHVAPVA